MHIHPTLSGQLAQERQREMLAQASRLRLARDVFHASLVTQRAEPAPPRKGLLLRQTCLAVSPHGRQRLRPQVTPFS
jgi:hypothetical protein